MRYSVISKGLSSSQIESELLKVGATGIRKTKLLNQLFCDLDERQAEKLLRIPRLKIRAVREVRATEGAVIEVEPQPYPGAPMPSVFGGQQAVIAAEATTVWDIFAELRSLFSPPLSGAGLTVAVLDSGIRESHHAFANKVVHEANFTESSTLDDVFGHGTQVAFVAAGYDPEGKAGVAPGAKLMNIKVLNDEGVGSDETVVDGIEEVIELLEAARLNGTHPTADLYPNVINISLGSDDDGDPDNPVRVACREAIQNYGLDVVSAIGNGGPKMSTIMMPSCEPAVIAVGGLQTDTLTIWEKSSRGPTLEGETKPDLCFWATSLEMASNKADDKYVAKTGTSFSAPMVSGLAGLLWEATRRSYGEDALFRWSIAREFAPYYCNKPADAPVKKDNTYGYGLPAMGAMIGQIVQVTTPMEQTMEAFPMLMMVGMMGMIVRGVA